MTVVNNTLSYTLKLIRVDPKCSHHKNGNYVNEGGIN